MRLQVTTMTLTRPPAPPPGADRPAGWAITEERLGPEAYLKLYGAVGESVRWDDRLRMEPERLADHLAAPTTRLFLLKDAERPVGLCEFEDCGPQSAVLANFGVVPDLRGRGLGRRLLQVALAAVWRPGMTIRLDTDTNDHPRAIPVYRHAGFETAGVAEKEFPD